MAQQITRSSFPSLTKCLTCNNMISNVNQKTISRLYCDECKAVLNKIRNTYRPKSKRSVNPRPCKYCGVVFTPKKKSTAEFCSTLCAIRKLHNVIINKTCQQCGIPIGSYGRRKYCGTRCKNISYYKRVEKKCVT